MTGSGVARLLFRQVSAVTNRTVDYQRDLTSRGCRRSTSIELRSSHKSTSSRPPFFLLEVLLTLLLSLFLLQGMGYFAVAFVLNALCLAMLYADVNPIMDYMVSPFTVVVSGIMACRAFQGESRVAYSQPSSTKIRSLTFSPILFFLSLRVTKGSLQKRSSRNQSWTGLGQGYYCYRCQERWRRFRFTFRGSTQSSSTLRSSTAGHYYLWRIRVRGRKR